jgi:hypothetical protein
LKIGFINGVRNRVKFKILGFGFILIGLVACASLRQDDTIDIFQKTQSYRNFSFDEVWSAALRSVDEIEFIARKTVKETGLIHAVARMNPDPQYLPPLVNVIIKEESGTIEVNFHIELPGQIDYQGKRRTYANRFFRALKNNLRK